MRSLPYNQRGLTFISLMLVLGLIAFFTLLVLKIAPIYFNHSKVLNALEAVEKSTDITSQPRHQILESLHKRFNMNYVEYVTDDDITIVAQPGYVKVDIDYDRVEPIMGNLSVLVEFHNGFEIGGQ
jgi:predicted membrane protein